MADFGPLARRRYLALDLRQQGADCKVTAAWLRRLSCPVLAVGNAGHPLAAACDVVVDHPDRLALLIARIEAAPIAAMVLVQLLRASAGMTAEAALLAESLAYATLQAGPEFASWLRGRKPVAELPAEPGEAVRIERQGDALRLQLNRPLARNAISVEMRDALCTGLDLACLDNSVREIKLSGLGRCFSVGGALAEFGTAPDPAVAHAVRSQRLPAALMLRCGERIHAKLHGACIGAGIEVPAFAARVTAAPGSFFQLPEICYGLIPGAGGTVSLERRIGRHRLGWLALSAQRIGARCALAWGLIDEIA